MGSTSDRALSSRASIAKSFWSSTGKISSSDDAYADALPADPPRGLWFMTRNPYAPVTVVMLHLLFSSHREWEHVWPKLTEYHLLIPDLPHHSRSRSIKPFSFSLAADFIADMIKEHAHDGRAHVVGISTGGYIAQELVRRHPELILSVFASGCCPLRNARLFVVEHPKMLHYGLLALLHSPNNMFLRASGWSPELQNADLLEEIKRNTTSRLSEYGSRDTRNFQQAEVKDTANKGMRVCIIAAGRQDDIEGARCTARIYRTQGVGEGSESRGYVIRDAIHAWNLQLPEVYAKGIQAWIERWQMPPEFELLE
ncbi:hypothetical protein JX266_013971 [Neoarthrinium moseri]|nr:hypothetical protein JX266_013971 [Neoarthrinium moseri]